MNEDDVWMSMVFLVAMNSNDPRTHIGAVIVDENDLLVSVGWNHMKHEPCFADVISLYPKDIERYNDKISRPGKYAWFEHAEREAIFRAVRKGVSTEGCTLYTNGIPCDNCARAIVHSGIKCVVYCKRWGKDKMSARWAEKCAKGQEILEWNDIELVPYTGSVRQIRSWQSEKHRDDIFDGTVIEASGDVSHAG